MAFVDTTVILRWLLGDHPGLSKKAEKLVDGATPHSLIITDIVVSEIVHILRATKRDRSQTAEALELLMRTPAFSYENEELTQDIMGLLTSTKLDYTNCYLIARARRSGQELGTFDVTMQRAYERAA